MYTSTLSDIKPVFTLCFQSGTIKTFEKLCILFHSKRGLYKVLKILIPFLGKQRYICCGLNFSLVENFSNQFNFWVSLSYYHNLKQREIKIKMV